MEHRSEQRALLDDAFRQSTWGQRFPAGFARHPTRANRWASHVFGFAALVSLISLCVAILTYVNVQAAGGSDATGVDVALLRFTIFTVTISIAIDTFAWGALQSENTVLRRVAFLAGFFGGMLSVGHAPLLTVVTLGFLVWAFPYTWWDRTRDVARIREQTLETDETGAPSRRSNGKMLIVSAVLLCVLGGFGAFVLLHATESNTPATTTFTDPRIITGADADAAYLADLHTNYPDVAAMYTDTELTRLGTSICEQTQENNGESALPLWASEKIPAEDRAETTMNVMDAVMVSAFQYYCPAPAMG